MQHSREVSKFRLSAEATANHSFIPWEIGGILVSTRIPRPHKVNGGIRCILYLVI